MVVQNRLADPPLRQALAKNPVVQAKVAGAKIEVVNKGEVTDDGLEELGLTLPCDDSQLRVIQLSQNGHCMQVEGPPGTGKSQTIANIISNALYHGRNVLLVCDKKAAIVQVEKRLSNVGLGPAMLNLHDEDLDKREFLRQATQKFPTHSARTYPFTQLKESRQTLNDRVRFARSVAHPSLQVTKREALAGLIQLKKELKNVPNIAIANWHTLSKERLTKLLGCLGEWPELAAVLADNVNVWNNVNVEAFDDNTNAKNELQDTIRRILGQLELLHPIREWSATVGMELPLISDADVVEMLALVETVLEKPLCHTELVGNNSISASELFHLQFQWERREQIVAARHPVVLSDNICEEPEKTALATAERMAKDVLRVEAAKTWEDLSRAEASHEERCAEIDSSQKAYRRLCEQIGLVYSPLLSVRRAQLQSVISLASLATAVPRVWWKSDTAPVLTIAAWKAHFQACATHAKDSPLPLHFVALERVATTHWEHVEAKAEHGFNVISYCFHFVNDRKCKYALRQVFPAIPSRGFKQWQEVTLHAVTALRTIVSLRAAADTHVVLKQLTSAYLAVAHEANDHANEFLSKDEVRALGRIAALVEQMRDRNDLFQIAGVHWQTFWESTNASLLERVKTVLSDFDSLALPDEQQSDNLEDALVFYTAACERIRSFIRDYAQREGDHTNSIMAGFAAQREFADCQQKLVPLTKYLQLQRVGNGLPDWKYLHDIIAWRDLFERLRGQQKLDIDSGLWTKLLASLKNHTAVIASSYQELNAHFERPRAGIKDYESLVGRVGEILQEMPHRFLWLEKKRWQGKISAFPEIKSLWSKTLDGSVQPSQGQRLFCFNLLRLCEPIAKPHGLQFKQTLKEFAEQDEKLASWVVDHLKANLRDKMDDAAQKAAQSESELRHLASLQRIRGTVRELANAHLDYLLAAKPCWLMSPTSLANLIDSSVFEEYGVPFDLGTGTK